MTHPNRKAPSGLLRSTAAILGGSLALTLSMSALAATTPGAGKTDGWVGLRSLASYTALAGSAVTNTGAWILNADLGVSPGDAVTGFSPGIVNGATHPGDADAAVAQSDLSALYADMAARTPTGSIGGDLGGQALGPGVYATESAGALTGQLTLDANGDPDALFVFQMALSV